VLAALAANATASPPRPSLVLVRRSAPPAVSSHHDPPTVSSHGSPSVSSLGWDRGPPSVSSHRGLPSVSSPGSRAWDRGRATRGDAVLNLARRHAAENNLELVIHSDDALPPLWHQLRAFSSASIVVAPMGAAQVMGMLALKGSKGSVGKGCRRRQAHIATTLCPRSGINHGLSQMQPLSSRRWERRR
jgi:hypothetical protein